MNLAEWLRKSPRPSSDAQLAMVAAVAQAVDDGHRDGKRYAGWSPSRIKVASDGSVDLSALSATPKPSEDLAYSAPESADGTTHTARSDVYSAGVILYEVLAGSHPFGGLSVRQPRGAPKPLRDVRADLSRDLADAVSACLERDPDWRPADLSYVLQVVRDLVKAPVPAPSRAPSGTRTPTASRRDATPSFGARPPASSGGGKLPLVIGVAVVLAGGGTAIWLWRSGKLTGSEEASPRPSVARNEAPTPTPRQAETPEPTPQETTTPAPAVASPTTVAAATATPTVRTPTAAPTVATPVATTAPVATAAPTTAPTEAPTAAPVAPTLPPVLKSLSPPKIRRGATTILDVRGESFRPDQQIRVGAVKPVKGREGAAGIQVGRQRVADPTLLQVVLNVDAATPPGGYTLTVVDSEGRASNALPFEIAN